MIKHLKVIERKRKLISMDVLDPEEAAEDGVFDDDISTLDEDDYGGLGGADVSTDVDSGETKETEEAQKAVKSKFI